jgi:hypothetical protein
VDYARLRRPFDLIRLQLSLGVSQRFCCGVVMS